MHFLLWTAPVVTGALSCPPGPLCWQRDGEHVASCAMCHSFSLYAILFEEINPLSPKEQGATLCLTQVEDLHVI